MLDKASRLLKEGTPFLIITDFEAEQVLVYTDDELHNEDIDFSFSSTTTTLKTPFQKKPISYEQYKKGFDKIIEKIKAGETYLLNYTCSTPINTPLTLHEIYNHAHAKFKLRFKDKFVCYSPEPFISIKGNTISTFPMKGTIDADVKDAKKKILANEKEMAEHVMVVDLLRNDLGIVATEVKVKKFRYIETLETNDKKLLQVSSEITATLPSNWRDDFGTLYHSLLPAGSISGTPKRSTLKIIKEVEEHQRDFFSGTFGYFNGQSFESAVMIRFIQQTQAGLVYKSGGGITLDSNAKEEYQEMQDKIYLP